MDTVRSTERQGRVGRVARRARQLSGLVFGVCAMLAATAAPASATTPSARPTMSREQQEDLARLFWTWGARARDKGPALSPARSPSSPPSPSSSSSCDVEVLSASGHEIPRTERARILFLGVSSTFLEKGERLQADEIFESELDLAAEVELTSFRDVEALLKVETARDVLGCDDATCMKEIGGAMGATALVRGNVGRLGGDLIVSGRVVDATTARVLGKTLVRTDDMRCLSVALGRASRLLFGAAHE